MPGLRRNFRASTAASACAGQFVNEAQAAVVNFRVALVLVVGLAGCAGRAKDPDAPALHTVDHVDLDRYLGTWYEIASYPQRFQRGCTATTANYSLGKKAEILVENQCRKDSLEGKLDVAKGRARVVDADTNAKLEVSFFRPFWGDYWIIDLGADYEYAVVGNPTREYLWILSRARTLDPAVYAGILERLVAQDYDIDRLQKTLQPAE